MSGGLRYCEAHTPPGAMNLALAPCASCGLEFVLTDGVCEVCDPKRFRRVQHKKEEGVAAAQAGAGIVVDARDKVLEPGPGCGRERPDFLIVGGPGQNGAWFVIVECDEDQHAHFTPECEDIRMRNLTERLKAPVVFIRFNPDAYTALRPWPLKDRYKVLVHWVKVAVATGPRPGETISVLQLFYDGFEPDAPMWRRLL
jgi:hypothetical protein